MISSHVFDEVISTQRDKIETVLNHIDFTNQSALEEAALRIRELISCAGFNFSQELLVSLDEIFGKDALFSVRSSVIGEDSPENSFAGQMDTFLNVRPPEVIGAIKKVWPSAFSSRALLYRRRKNMRLTEISTAVIIQEMVQPVASGVLFTREPESGAKQCLIAAGFGLGEGIVCNRVETDTYRIGWDSNEIFKLVKVKDYRVILNEEGRGGNRTESVPPELQLKQILTDAQIKQLRDIAVKAEKCFGAPQDIEWAFDGSGRLSLLQSRHIVFTTDKVFSSAVRIWDNSNIVESYPGLTLPLTFTFICKVIRLAFVTLLSGFYSSRMSLERTYTFLKT